MLQQALGGRLGAEGHGRGLLQHRLFRTSRGLGLGLRLLHGGSLLRHGGLGALPLLLHRHPKCQGQFWVLVGVHSELVAPRSLGLLLSISPKLTTTRDTHSFFSFEPTFWHSFSVCVMGLPTKATMRMRWFLDTLCFRAK